ncbi:hypothetical protein LCGC14_0464730 [marine sediment metagenome]|uniref:Uncharacterized protein n=1 Tax=marine sediment metagenome TaxID=412755 RepID=A0A0F9V0S5_9ZZZZ
MIEIPKTILIGCHEIKVVMTDDNLEADASGRFDSDSETIYLKTGMSDKQTFNVFLHECLEAIDSYYQLKIGNWGEMENNHWKIMSLNEGITSIFNQLTKEKVKNNDV